MKATCVGGGPGGLYFAILMKLADPSHVVTVLERKPAGVTDGWGVVFWDDLVEGLRAADPETAERVTAAAFEWRGQTLDLNGAIACADGRGYSIVRSKLLEILASRATGLGVDLRFDHAVIGASELSDADIVVAADGANSIVRRLKSDDFGTEIVTGRNKYLWLGTTRVFDRFTFPYVDTPAGWIWAHAYGIDTHTSTFIVECPPETWSGLGFDALVAPDGLARLEEIFGHRLDGEHLASLGPPDAVLPWRSFRTITNEHWHSGNTVLLGDAAHTTHFSIGSGMRLALQDAMTLATTLGREATPELAFAAYESTRRHELERTQSEARLSARWFENVDRYIHLPAPAFFQLLQACQNPFAHRLPPRVYLALYPAADRFGFLRTFRSWAMPKARALYFKVRR